MEDVVKIDNSKYPKLLRELGKDAPKQLYYKGNWPFDTAQGKDDIFENCLAVVGSRRMTSYGRQITEKLVSEIAVKGVTIVSGFMYGIDSQAHKAALQAGGRTIAVMPCGIDLIHPDYQEDLYKEILDNKGLVISEYEGNFLPTLWTYPRRNRIVAGLSKAVMVVEAGEKSGSLITANFAKKYKRKVFVVPGPLTSSLSVGIGQLIKEGAEVVTGAGDVLDFFGRGEVSSPNQNKGRETPPLQGLSLMEQRIIEKLQQESMEIDVLSRMLGVSAAQIGTVVSLMQIKGLIFGENGKFYIR